MRRWLLLLGLLVAAGLALWAFRAEDADEGTPLDTAAEQNEEASARHHDVDAGAVLRGTGATADAEASPSAECGLTLAGTIFDPDGVATGYAVVVLERALDGEGRWEDVTRRPSAPSGRFAFEGLAPGRYLLSALWPPGLLSPVQAPLGVPGEGDAARRVHRARSPGAPEARLEEGGDDACVARGLLMNWGDGVDFDPPHGRDGGRDWITDLDVVDRILRHRRERGLESIFETPPARAPPRA